MEPKATAAESKPTHEEIAALAYQIYEQEGCQQGRSVDHWQQAELLLKNGRSVPGPKTGDS